LFYVKMELCGVGIILMLKQATNRGFSFQKFQKRIKMYTPDKWVLLKMTFEKQVCYKILAGWNGGYLDGDSWKLNSGCKLVTKDGDYYKFIGYSGSIYKCHKDMYSLTTLTASILTQLMEKYPKAIEVVPDNTDFMAEINR
jgi:hypothetical protein